MNYPDAKAPKFTHIVRVRTAGAVNAHTLCGRMTSFMNTREESEATCQRCVAESLSRAALPVREG